MNITLPTSKVIDIQDHSALDMLSSGELLLIDQALTYYAQSRHLEATERQRDQFRAKHTKRDDALAATLGAESAALRRKAADISNLQDKITRAGDLFYSMDGE